MADIAPAIGSVRTVLSARGAEVLHLLAKILDLRPQITDALFGLIVTPVGAGTNFRLKCMHLVPRLGLRARGTPPGPGCGLVY